MRDGRLVFTRDRSDLTIAEMVGGMVGDDQERMFPPRPAVGATAIEGGSLEVRDLTAGDELTQVSFTARPGEIIGLAGLEGAGVATLLGVLFGTRRPSAGDIRLPDGGGAPRSPTDAARRGVALVPADRRHQGLMLDRSVARNVLHGVRRCARTTGPAAATQGDGPGSAAPDRATADQGPERLDGGRAACLGGNQQKVVIGKWLEVAPRVMLLDDPTRGVDVGAKREIYLLIRALADDGRVVLFRSTELPELVGLADRILVFYRGRLATEIRGADATDHGVLTAINTGYLPQQAIQPEPPTTTAQEVRP